MPNINSFTKKVLAVVLGLSIVFTQSVDAAALLNLSDTMSSLKVSTLSSHAIRFTTPTGAAESTDTIIITFPSDFNFTGKTIGTVSLTHGATTGLETTETLAASPSTTAWGAVFSGTQNRILTLTAPTDGVGAGVLDPNDKVIISYTSASSTNPTTATSTQIGVTGAFGDTGTITVNILTDDQVVVTATVPQSLTLSISDNTIGFGSLIAAGPRFATGDTNGNGSEVEAHTLVVGTNALNGYSLSLNGTTLTYASSTIDQIGSTNTASVPGTEQFGIRMTASGGTGTVAARYSGAGYAFATSTFPDQIASAAGTTANTTYSVRYLANISSNTEAGSYGATLTYTATANF